MKIHGGDMQRFILKNKNKITLAGGVLIIFAFFAKLILKSSLLFEIPMIIASVICLLPIAIQAFQALRVKVISIDTLVTTAVLGAFLINNFEESAMVTFLFLFGAYLEQRTLNKTRSAIKELTEMAAVSALRLVNKGEFEEIDVDDVDIGDILLVKTGAKVPVDGIVIAGEASLNEASITGESYPKTKKLNSNVFAGTIVDNGTIQIKAERLGEDTTFGKIIELVEEAQDSKSEAERFIDRFSRWYTPTVLILAFIIWIFSQKIELAITVLVLGCPGALVIGVPVSNVAGIGNGAKNGILLKGSEVINEFSKVDTIIFDKTGTLTEGNPTVAEKSYYTNNIEDTLIFLASIERESDHPLAKAIVQDIEAPRYLEVESTVVIKGEGIIARIEDRTVSVGNMALMERQKVNFTGEMINDIQDFEQKGNSLVLTAIDGDLKAIMGIRDQIRNDVKKNLDELKRLGVKNLVVLSGDNQGTVDKVSSELGLTEAHGNMLPEDKALYVKDLMANKNQIVAFVGDGVNDSPSLATANIGIAMGSGTDVAIETSDVVLMNSDFGKLPHALGLVKAISRNMKQNILIAVGVVIILLASVLFSEWMNMTIGMLVHEGSILVVVLNGMRLLKYRLKRRII